jgi:hypothetical protein
MDDTAWDDTRPLRRRPRQPALGSPAALVIMIPAQVMGLFGMTSACLLHLLAPLLSSVEAPNWRGAARCRVCRDNRSTKENVSS